MSGNELQGDKNKSKNETDKKDFFSNFIDKSLQRIAKTWNL